MTENPLADRVRKIMELKSSNPSNFAEQIDINRSTMNHILNERNKPSLEVITKILEKYPDINSDWLILGKGPIFSSEKVSIQTQTEIQTSFDFDNVAEMKPSQEEKPIVTEGHKEVKTEEPVETPKIVVSEEIISVENESRKVNKIMIFYSDNTFACFTPDMKPFE